MLWVGIPVGWPQAEEEYDIELSHLNRPDRHLSRRRRFRRQVEVRLPDYVSLSTKDVTNSARDADFLDQFLAEPEPKLIALQKRF